MVDGLIGFKDARIRLRTAPQTVDSPAPSPTSPTLFSQPTKHHQYHLPNTTASSTIQFPLLPLQLTPWGPSHPTSATYPRFHHISIHPSDGSLLISPTFTSNPDGNSTRHLSVQHQKHVKTTHRPTFHYKTCDIDFQLRRRGARTRSSHEDTLLMRMRRRMRRWNSWSMRFYERVLALHCMDVTGRWRRKFDGQAVSKSVV